MALARTLPMGSLADCGAKASAACAWSAGSPRIRSTTRRALRGVTRTYRAFALASIALSRSLCCASSGVGTDRATGGCAGRRELAELVPDHRLGDEHRHVLAAVVHRDGVAEHGRHDHGPARPGPDHG